MARARRKKQGQAQTDEDGWTVVAGSSGNPSSSSSSSPRGDRDETPVGPRPQKVVSGLTVEKLGDEFRAMERRWRKTSCARNLEAMLRTRDWTVENGVCVGVGSFSVDWEHRYRSLWQLALFVGVVGMLNPPTRTTPLPLHAQDPAFTALDTAFLGTLNITVHASAIESHIVRTTFVFAPFVDWPLLLPLFLRDTDAELYIGNDVLDDYAPFANSPPKTQVLALCNRLGARFRHARERRKVPAFELHGGALEGLVVWWRGEDGEDGEGE